MVEIGILRQFFRRETNRKGRRCEDPLTSVPLVISYYSIRKLYHEFMKYRKRFYSSEGGNGGTVNNLL